MLTKFNVYMNKYTKSVEKHPYLLAYLLSLLAHIAIYTFSRVFPFGSNVLCRSDLGASYIPIILKLKHIILNGGSLLHDWSIIDGSTPLGIMNVGILFQIGLPFLMLLDDTAIPMWIGLYQVLRLSCLSLTMMFCLNKLYSIKSTDKLLLSVAYSVNPFTVAYSCVIIWTDSVMILPLFFVALQYFLKDKPLLKFIPNPLLYFLLVTFSLLNNFYMAYIIAVYMGLNLFVFLFKKGYNIKQKMIKVFQLIFVYLSSLLITLPVLYSSLKLLININQDFHSYMEYLHLLLKSIYSPAIILEKLSSPIITSVVSVEAAPFIFVGVTTLFLLSFYRVGKDGSLGEILILLFLLFSSSNAFFYMMWHGFDVPDGFPCRFGFILSFHVILILAHVMESLPKKVNKKHSLVTIAILIVIAAVNHLRQPFIDNQLYIALVTDLSILSLLMFTYLYLNSNRKYFFSIKFLYGFETLFAACILFSGTAPLDNIKKVPEMYGSPKLTQTLCRLREDKPLLGRVVILHDKDDLSFQAGYIGNVDGVCSFNNLINRSTVWYTNALSGDYRTNLILNNYQTPLSQLLLNETYVINGDGKIVTDNRSKHFSIGYMIEDKPYLKSFRENEAQNCPGFYKIQNQLCHELLNTTEDLWIKIQPDKVEHKEGEYSYVHYSHLDSQKTYRFATTRLYGTGINPGVVFEITEGLTDKRIKSDLINSCKPNSLGQLAVKAKPREILNSSNNKRVLDYLKVDYEIGIYELNEHLHKQLEEELTDEVLIVDEKDDMSIKGHVTAKKDGLLFVSIPYSSYSIKVDNREVKYKESIPGFVGIPVPKGLHCIDIKYSYWKPINY